MKIRRIIATMIIILIVIAMGISVVAIDDNQEKKTVRIGAFSIEHMQEKNEEGEYVGYSYEYLQSIQPYTNWEYEYVEGSFAECYQWLLDGEIDILGCVIKNPEREELLDFVDYYTGFNGTKLLVKSDNTTYAANDYEQFDGIVVGVQQSLAHEKQLLEFSKEKGFKVNIVHYATEAEILEALDKGEIEAACLSALKVESWTRIIATFEILPYFYAVKKGNTEILDELNAAIGEKKNDDPMFEENLRRKYHTNESKNTVVFSQAEKDYIEKADTITVAYDSNFMPIEGLNEKTDLPNGYTIEVLERITEMTGLNFKYVTTDTYLETLQLLLDNKADILSSFNKSVMNVPSDRLSNYYLNLSVVLIGKSDFYFNIYDNIKVAMPLRSKEFVDSVKKVYPNCEFLYFDSTEDAYEAVVKGEADLIARNIYSAQLDIVKDYSDFRIIYDLNETTLSKFLFAEDTPKELISIFNKCIASFTEAETNAMMTRATIEQIDTTSQTVRIVIVSLLALVLAIFAIWLALHLIKARRRLVYSAFYDQLTGLPNLTKFKIEAKKMLQENPKCEYAILLTDIADFSVINEKYGFETGDLVIKSVGDAITQLKSYTTLTARISSNMFINLYVYDEQEESTLTTNPLIHSYKYRDTFIHFFHYFGRYLIPVGETDVDAIYEKASYAHLFAKKNNIKSRIVDYDHEAKKTSVRNQEIESKMHGALKRKDFKVFMQPKYKCDGKTLIGAEALVRWFDSTTDQMIFPNDFIPLFERNGFVTKLDVYMFEEVCRILSEWEKSDLELVRVSVNFSRLHFSNEKMADELFEITQKYGLDTKYLEIEITENALSTKLTEISAMIEKLYAYGFKISLDDFSSQDSSLLFLAEVPVDVVKLDKAFVSRIAENNVSRLLIDGTIKILKQLNFKVVAEGVETHEQVKLLDDMNCDIIQGYVFSKPIPAEDMRKLLSSNKDKAFN